MRQETERALEELTPGPLDLYSWTRRLAMRVAMRALFGLDPDGEPARGTDAAGLFERALSFYATEYTSRFLRGPLTPYAHLQSAAKELNRVIYAEINRRRATGARGEDVLSLLLDAHDEDGSALSDRQVRDEVMTLLFAGHDTTTSTVSFMFYELAHHPEIAQRLVAEQRERLRGLAAFNSMMRSLPRQLSASASPAIFSGEQYLGILFTLLRLPSPRRFRDVWRHHVTHRVPSIDLQPVFRAFPHHHLVVRAEQ